MNCDKIEIDLLVEVLLHKCRWFIRKILRLFYRLIIKSWRRKGLTTLFFMARDRKWNRISIALALPANSVLFLSVVIFDCTQSGSFHSRLCFKLPVFLFTSCVTVTVNWILASVGVLIQHIADTESVPRLYLPLTVGVLLSVIHWYPLQALCSAARFYHRRHRCCRHL